MLKIYQIIYIFLFYFTSITVEAGTNVIISNEDQEFNKKIKEFILNNPETIIDALENYKKNSEEIFYKKTKLYLETNLTEIQNTNYNPYSGNINGDITIVMFFDYTCGYCKKANAIINQILDIDKNLKVIYKPYPVLGERSSYIAQIALSVYLEYPNKFKEFHNTLMGLNQISENSVKEILKQHNIQLHTVNSSINHDKLTQIQQQNFLTGKELHISGVPTFIINGNVYNGMLSFANLDKIIKDIRRNEHIVSQ
jgi:protein-disulfide isomerase